MTLFIDFALVTGILFCSFILFSFFKKKKQYGRIMVLLFVLILSVLINYYGFLHKLIYLVIPTILFSDCIDVVAGPLFYIYIKSLFLNERNIISKNIYHFLFPFIDSILVSLPTLIVIFVSKPWLKTYLIAIEPYAPLTIVYSLIYCILSLKLLYKFRKVLKKNYSNLDNKDLKWLEVFLIGSIVVISVDFSTSIYSLIFDNFEWQEGYLTAVALVLLIIHLGFHGISQSNILIPQHLIPLENEDQNRDNTKPLPKPELKQLASDKNKETINSETEKTQQESITPLDIKKENTSNPEEKEEMIKMENNLIAIMKEKQPFLIEDLTLRMLAEMLLISDKKLSKLLNQFMHTSFYDFINKHRVDEVKRRILNEDHLNITLLAIAYESGFKSKTSFNRIFKSTTGHSPSEFKKKTQKVPK